MEIAIKWFNDQFNVALSSAAGVEPFLEVKGCRIVAGSNGAFVSYPAKKNEQTGKWWNHVWGSERFNAAVLAKAQESQPKATPKPQRSSGAPAGDDGDIPFADPLKGRKSLAL